MAARRGARKIPDGFVWFIHDRAPGDVLPHAGTVAGVDCIRDLGPVQIMYIQDAIDAGAEVCPRCMPRPDAIAYDIRVEQRRATVKQDDGSVTTYVAHVEVKKVVKQRSAINMGKEPTGSRDVTDVGQMTVRATSLSTLAERINAAAAVVCDEDAS